MYSDPYAEVFVGKPFVQTVDLKNLTEVEEALRDIINSEVIIIIIFFFTSCTNRGKFAQHKNSDAKF